MRISRSSTVWLLVIAFAANGCRAESTAVPRAAPLAGNGVAAAKGEPTVASPDASATPGGFSVRTYALDARGALSVQNEVDSGRQPWRLDPILVARSTLESEGIDASRARFAQSDLADEVGTGRRRATVRATTSGGAYDVDLLQPARQGATGIWVATGLRRAG